MKRYGIAGTVAAALLAAVHGFASAQSSRPGAPAAVQVSQGEEGVRWDSLTAGQRETLAPLQREWSSIDALRKQKWIALASRFGTLSPTEQARITARMSEWARLTPSERGQARLRFEAARSVPAPDRNARWQAYQALPPDARQRLAERAASTPADRLEAPANRGSSSARDARDGKANVVPNPATLQPPKQVAPTLLQAAPGATTTPITRRPAPPPHQQTGMPKIAANPEFVNRSTLLPKRGPQAAAVTPTSVRPALPVQVTPITQPLALPPATPK